MIVRGRQNGCNFLYLTTEHVFEDFAGQLLDCPLPVVWSAPSKFLKLFFFGKRGLKIMQICCSMSLFSITLKRLMEIVNSHKRF